MGWAHIPDLGWGRRPKLHGMQALTCLVIVPSQCTASTSGSSSCESWVLAADNPTASGRPVASISRWYLEPALPRSTGFAPVSSPHAAPAPHAVDGRSGPVGLAVVA